MSEIKLTLGTAAAPAPVVAAPQPVVEKPKPAEPVFTPEEQQMIDEFSRQIDITNSSLVFQYGAGAQQNIANFSDTALESVRSKDLGEVGDMISSLVVELRDFTAEPEEERGFFSFLRKKVDRVQLLKARYDEAEVNVNKIVSELEGHQVQLLKDIALLDQLYQLNLTYFKELSMYIAAGKKSLAAFRSGPLAEARAKAQASGLPEDAQHASDMGAMADRFEKKLFDLDLTRNVAIQMSPQIRLIQNNDQVMAEKIQSTIVNTIPLWKSQMVIAMGLQHSQDAMRAQRAVTDLTNSLLRANAEKLRMGSIEVAREAERGVIDIETLIQTNQTLISTMDEVLTIQQEGRNKRREAEANLRDIEQQLKTKLLEMHTSN